MQRLGGCRKPVWLAIGATSAATSMTIGRVTRNGAGSTGAIKKQIFAVHHPADRTAVLLLTVMLWFALLSGFVPDSLAQLAKGRAFPVAIYFHALAAFDWMLLLTSQMVQVRFGRMVRHQMTGRRLGAAVAILVVVTAMGAAVGLHHVEMPSPTYSPAFLAVQVGNIIPIFVLTLAALRLTRQPAAHKRRLLLGIAAVLGPATSRWLGQTVGPTLGPLPGDGSVAIALQLLLHYAAAWALIAAMAPYGWRPRGRLHPLLLPAVGLILAGELGPAWLARQPWWPDLARTILGG